MVLVGGALTQRWPALATTISFRDRGSTVYPWRLSIALAYSNGDLDVWQRRRRAA